MDSCEDRERYESYRKADERAWYEMSRAPAVHGQPLRMLVAYQCAVCGLFHVGTRPDRQRALHGRTASDVA